MSLHELLQKTIDSISDISLSNQEKELVARSRLETERAACAARILEIDRALKHESVKR